MDIEALTTPPKAGNPVEPWAEGARSEADAGKWYHAAVRSRPDAGGLNIASRSFEALICYVLLQVHRIGLRLADVDRQVGATAVGDLAKRMSALEAAHASAMQTIWKLHETVQDIAAVDTVASQLRRNADKPAARKAKKGG